MNQWQQQPGPNWGSPPGPPQQYYQQPGYPQQYPGYQYPPPRRAGGGAAATVIALGFVIAFIQALSCIGHIGYASDLSDDGNAPREWIPGFLYLDGFLRFLAAGALVVGAVMLTQRNPAGRWMTVGASVTLVLFQILESAVYFSVQPSAVAKPLSILVTVILPIALVILAFTGSTRRWLDEGRPRR